MKFTDKELRTIYYLCKAVYCFGSLNDTEKEEDVLPLWNKLKKHFGYEERKPRTAIQIEKQRGI